MSGTLRIQDISLENTVIGKSQARASDLQKGIEDLAASMEKWGLLEPITVFVNDDKKYEILAGQRRFTAAKKLGWKTIPSVIRPKPADEYEAKALSLTENVTTNPMTAADIMDACEMLMKRYNNPKMVAQAIGISVNFVNKYVKYSRLPESLQRAVDNGELGDIKQGISVALKAVDALQYEPGGSVPEKKVLELARILAKKTPKQRNDIVEEAKKDPERPLKEIETKAEEPKKEKSLTLVMPQENYLRLQSYQEKTVKSSPEDAALELIADGLEEAGF